MSRSPSSPEPDPGAHRAALAGGAFDRRALLAGVAGLAIGAGATEAGNLLSSPGRPAAPTGPGIEPPGEDLMAEHGVLERLLLIYQAALARMGNGLEPPAAQIHAAAEVVHDFVESFHESLEEGYVFPRLRAAGQLVDTVDTLLLQHARGRLITQLVLADATAGRLASSAVRDRVTAAIEAFVRMYRPHEAREDTVVYPAYRALLDTAESNEIGAAIDELQRRQLGPHGFDHVVAQVAAIERQLGIYDLGQFTPAAP